MHIFFSGIGGMAIGPLALIAKEAGYSVSGSDKIDYQNVQHIRDMGITDISIGQSYDDIAAVHAREPIDWFVYSSAVLHEQPDADEFRFCRDQDIKMSKRDELLNFIIDDKKLQLIAISGTQGKTTTTSLTVWLFKQLGMPVSYSVGAKPLFGDLGQYQPGSKYFVYEADEFDRNFLAFEPHLSIISGVSWDHHEIFPTREDYQAAFREFISQSKQAIIWQEDADYLGLDPDVTTNLLIQDSAAPGIEQLTLVGQYNRLDAWLAIQAVHHLTKAPIDQLAQYANQFPGSERRMEQLVPNLYTDYAHTADKVRGAMSVALELAGKENQRVVVVYEPHANRRQQYMIDEYSDSFEGAAKIYWLPTYLAREDPTQRVIPPAEFISRLSDPTVGEVAEMGDQLKAKIAQHLADGDMVVAMTAGPLDEWLRKEFSA